MWIFSLLFVIGVVIIVGQNKRIIELLEELNKNK